MDRLTPEGRSWLMSRVGSKDTKPELVVRRLVFAMGYRYRLHSKHLPGSPDLVFPGRKKVIFVNGCFWHGHDCHLFKLPETRREFWIEKINSNRQRDRLANEALIEGGWRVAVVWECARAKVETGV